MVAESTASNKSLEALRISRPKKHDGSGAAGFIGFTIAAVDIRGISEAGLLLFFAAPVLQQR